MPVQYNAKPPQEYVCDISRKIMNAPICARWPSGRFMNCDSAVFKRWNESSLTQQNYHDANSVQTEPRPDLEQAISLWKKEHVVEPIDPAQLGVFIAENSLDRIEPNLLNAYLRYIFAMAKTNDAANSVVVVGKHRKEAPPSFNQLRLPQEIDNLSQCVLQLILSEARRELDRAPRNQFYSDYSNTGWQQSVQDRQIQRGMGVLSYTPAVGSRSETQTCEVVAPWKPPVGQGDSSESYCVWPVGGEPPRFQGEHLGQNSRNSSWSQTENP